MNIGTFKDDWEVSLSDKQVRIRTMSLLEKVRRWGTRYPLSKFHSFVRQNFEATEQGIMYPVILNSDYMKPVEGVPTKLELVNGWNIPETSLKKLVGDNHVLISQETVIVKEHRSKIYSSLELKPGFMGFSIDLKKLFGKK